MVDFRYHLVSLISVFLALAIGIILGAGPLQNSIGNALSGEVDNLRKVNDELKAENTDLSNVIANQDAAISTVAPTLINDTLTGRKIAFIALPNAPEQDMKLAQEKIEAAGGTITGTATITEAWTAAEQSAYRASFADQIRSYIKDLPDEADANTVLVAGLSQLMRLGFEAIDNTTLKDLMTGTDSPVIDLKGGETAANAVVLFTADNVDPATAVTPPSTRKQAQQDYDLKTFTDLAAKLSTFGPTVLAGAGDTDNDVVRTVRGASHDISTVDSAHTHIGAINIVIALAHEINSKTVHFGFNEGASTPLGQRTVASVPPAPTPEPTSSPNEDESEGTDK